MRTYRALVLAVTQKVWAMVLGGNVLKASDEEEAIEDVKVFAARLGREGQAGHAWAAIVKPGLRPWPRGCRLVSSVGRSVACLARPPPTGSLARGDPSGGTTTAPPQSTS